MGKQFMKVSLVLLIAAVVILAVTLGTVLSASKDDDVVSNTVSNNGGNKVGTYSCSTVETARNILVRRTDRERILVTWDIETCGYDLTYSQYPKGRFIRIYREYPMAPDYFSTLQYESLGNTLLGLGNK